MPEIRPETAADLVAIHALVAACFPSDAEARLIDAAMDKAIANKTVTYDFARLMDGAKEVKCSEFADELIKAM